MLQAFIDDSASDSRFDKRMVLAGYLATFEVWERFAADWASTLASPPVLRALHMSGSWHGFTKAQKEQKIDALVEVLERYKPLSVECSVSRRDYEEILKPSSPFDLRHPYFACFIGVMNGVSGTIDAEGLVGPAELIFDEQGNVGHAAALWYMPVKQMNPRLAANLSGPPSFKDDEDVLPLQAADMLAWHVRPCGESNCTEHQLRVARAIRFRHRYMDIPRPLLVQWAAVFDKTPGIGAVKTRKGSVKRQVAGIVSSVPSDELIPTMEAIWQRGRRLLMLKAILERVGLRSVWKWLSKRLKIRWRPLARDGPWGDRCLPPRSWCER